MGKTTVKSRRAALIAAIVIYRRARRHRLQAKRRTRQWWVNPWLMKRREQGAYNNLVTELRETDKRSYKNFLRMDEANFNFILNSVRPYIEKKDTRLREAISADQRLCITLRFLATGI